MPRRLLCLLACNAAAFVFVVGVHTGSAGAASSITVSPSQNLTAGQTVTVSGSGFAPNGQGAIVECNGTPSPPQPTIMVAGNPVPVGCTNPLDKVVSFDGSGNLPPTQFTIKTGTIGPPAAGQDSAGKDAATDAKDYPCPPTAAQQSQTIPCVIAVGDSAKNQGTQVITFQAATTTTAAVATTVPTTTATTVAATTAATNPPVVQQETTATTAPAQLSRTGSSQRLIFLAVGGAILLDAGYLLFSSTRRSRLLLRRQR